MFSIGQLSRFTGVKVPTIRYYEGLGLISAPERTRGNQRRYHASDRDQLAFIKHARDLGFSINAISALMDLQQHPDRSCKDATDIARAQLADVKAKISKLRALERELSRISLGCEGTGSSSDCYVLAALADHQGCGGDH